MDSSFLEVASCSNQEAGGDVQYKHGSKSASRQTTLSDSEDGCFQCNICLESAHEPVVTLCGHLYCWPCIYKWLYVHGSHEGDQSQKCPVCQVKISSASLVPLYGSGASQSKSAVKKSQLDPVVPRRPPSTTASTSHSNQHLRQNYFPSQPHPFHHHHHYFPEAYGVLPATPSFLRRTAVSSLLLNPTIGTFGEMIFSRIFGSPGGTLFPPYSNVYPRIGTSSPRMRRQELEIEKSLRRISFFLFCCVALCLLLF